MISWLKTGDAAGWKSVVQFGLAIDWTSREVSHSWRTILHRENTKTSSRQECRTSTRDVLGTAAVPNVVEGARQRGRVVNWRGSGKWSETPTFFQITKSAASRELSTSSRFYTENWSSAFAIVAQTSTHHITTLVEPLTQCRLHDQDLPLPRTTRVLKLRARKRRLRVIPPLPSMARVDAQLGTRQLEARYAMWSLQSRMEMGMGTAILQVLQRGHKVYVFNRGA